MRRMFVCGMLQSFSARPPDESPPCVYRQRSRGGAWRRAAGRAARCSKSRGAGASRGFAALVRTTGRRARVRGWGRVMYARVWTLPVAGLGTAGGDSRREQRSRCYCAAKEGARLGWCRGTRAACVIGGRQLTRPASQVYTVRKFVMLNEPVTPRLIGCPVAISASVLTARAPRCGAPGKGERVGATVCQQIAWLS